MDKRKCMDTLYQNFREEIEKVGDEKLKVNEFGDEYFIYLKIKQIYREEARMVTGEMDLDKFWYDMGWSPSNNEVFAGVLGDCEEEFFELTKEDEDIIRKIIQNSMEA
jgi:hypothetical protein